MKSERSEKERRKEQLELLKDMRESRKKSPILSKIASYGFSAMAHAVMLVRHPIHLGTYLSGKLFKPTYFYGLFEGSIISPNQMHVIDDNTGKLKLEKAGAGEYVGYDFKRNTSIGLNRCYSGKIISFELDDLENQPINALTLPKAFSLTDLEYVFSFDTPSLDYLLSHKFVSETTMETAFDKQGLLKQYEHELYLKGIANRTVYEVTPKAHTRIFISKRSGDKKPREQFLPEFNPVRA